MCQMPRYKTVLLIQIKIYNLNVWKPIKAKITCSYRPAAN